MVLCLMRLHFLNDTVVNVITVVTGTVLNVTTGVD